VYFVNNARFWCELSDGRAGNRTYRADTLFWWWLILHTSILEHVRPFPTRAGMAMFQVLSKMICAEELLGMIAFAKFVHVIQMLGPHLPIRGKWELLPAITAYIGCTRMGLGGVEGRLYTCKRSARPRMTPEMERILVPFGLVLILETIRAELASVLFL
jgi:hypothetical protein